MEADEEWSDARRLSKEETLRLIETKVLELLRAVKQGENPSMTLVNTDNLNKHTLIQHVHELCIFYR